MHIISKDTIALSNLNLNVNSEAAPVSPINSYDDYSFSLISEAGDILIEGQNRYFCRDILIKAGRDVEINFITLLLTKYGYGALPSALIEANGYLWFSEEASISGGQILLSGRNGIEFLS